VLSGVLLLVAVVDEQCVLLNNDVNTIVRRCAVEAVDALALR
jgi:hypothetical protein